MKTSTPKNDLSKRLKTYSALAGALVTAGAAKAGIVYTDVDPDVVLTKGDSYNLDLNADNSVDFTFSLTSLIYSFYGFSVPVDAALVGPVAGNGFIASSTSYLGNKFYLGISLAQGDTIDANGAWVNAPMGALAAKGGIQGIYSLSGGNFLNVTDKYLALQFKIGANTHYGWVRLDGGAAVSSITIKDYAYNDTPNESLKAGQTASSIKEFSALKNVSAYSFQNKININFSNGSLPKGTVSILNALGQNVYSTNVSSAQNQITIDEPAGNFYIVSLQTEEGIYTKKVFLKNN